MKKKKKKKKNEENIKKELSLSSIPRKYGGEKGEKRGILGSFEKCFRIVSALSKASGGHVVCSITTSSFFHIFFKKGDLCLIPQDMAVTICAVSV